jgi:hypothetical protein
MKKTLTIALLLPIAYAADTPDLKEGLWSVHTQTSNDPGNTKSEGTYTLCRSHAFDKATEARAKSLKGCSMISENSQGNKYSAHMKCMVAGTAIETNSTSTFQGDTSFHSESRATYTPALHGLAGMTIILDQKYVGSCPAGVQPGDRTNADGSVIHLGKR